MGRFFVLAAGMVSLAAMGATVTVNPGNGVVTNVQEVFSGDTALLLNSGTTGGGIVSLNEANTHTGGTTVKSGTLVLGSDSLAGYPGELGRGGDLTVGRATLRVPAGKSVVVSHPVTNTATSKYSTRYDVEGELTIAADVLQQDGAFVKTGGGVLRLTGPGENKIGVGARTGSISTTAKTGGYYKQLVPAANGDAPTVGYGGFTVADGTVVLGEGGGTFYLNADANAPTRIGAWTADEGAQEKSAALEVRGGFVTNLISTITIGTYNGMSVNTPDYAPTSAVRVYAGTLTVNTIEMGWFNPTSISHDDYTQNSAPRLEVHGGEVALNRLYPSSDVGCNSTVIVDGDGFLKVPGYIYCGRRSAGNLTVDISGQGRMQVPSNGMYADYAKSNGTVRVYVHDGGAFLGNRFISDNTTTGDIRLNVDGGTLETTTTGSDQSFGFLNAAADVRVGAKGMDCVLSGWRQRYFIRTPITTAEGVEKDGGVSFSQSSTRGGSGAKALIAVPQAYNGPTRILGVTNRAVHVCLTETGRLPSVTDLSIEGLSQLLITNGVDQTVASLSLEGNPILAIIAAHPLSVDGLVQTGTGTVLKVAVRSAADAFASVGDGTYTVLSAAASARAVLEAMPVVPQDSGVTFTDVRVEDAGEGRVALVVDMAATATADVGAAWNAAAGGDWNDPASWTGGGVPSGTGQTASFTAAMDGTAVTLAPTTCVGNVSFAGGTFTLSGGVLKMIGAQPTFTIASDATVCLTASAAGDVLVLYPPSCADPDLSRIALDAASVAAGLAPVIRTIPAGEYAGWRAIVADVPTATWAATISGGLWNEPANWTDDAPPSGPFADAAFPAAASSAVPVALGAGVTLNSLAFTSAVPDSAPGYTFGGAAPQILEVTAQAGTHTFSDGLDVAAQDVSIDVTTAAVVRVTGLSGTGRLTANPTRPYWGGRLELTGLASYGGRLRTGSGTVAVDSLAFVNDAADLELGPGTLLYQGADATIPGFTVYASRLDVNESTQTNRASVIEIPSGVTLTAQSVQAPYMPKSALCKYGDGTLLLDGAGPFVLGNGSVDAISNRRAATINEFGDGPDVQMRIFNVDQGTVVIGREGGGDLPYVENTDLCIGSPRTTSDHHPRLEMKSGHAVFGNLYVGYQVTGSYYAYPELVISGGRMDVTSLRMARYATSWAWTRASSTITVNGGTLAVGEILLGSVNYTRTPVGTINVNGGEMLVSGDMVHGPDKGRVHQLDINVSGGLLDVEGYIDLCAALTNTSKRSNLTLSGGQLRAETVKFTGITRAGEKDVQANMTFDGGTFLPKGRNAANRTLGGFTSFSVTANGGTISTALMPAGSEYSVTQALTGPGGLVKTGEGTLVLDAANTFAGDLLVEEGAVRLGADGSTAGAIVVADGATLYLGGVTKTLAGLGGAGRVLDGNVQLADGATWRCSGDGALYIRGDLACAGTLTVDLGRGVDDPVTAGERFALAVADGTVTMPQKVALTGTGTVNVFGRVSSAAGAVSITVTHDGMAIFLK